MTVEIKTKVGRWGQAVVPEPGSVSRGITGGRPWWSCLGLRSGSVGAGGAEAGQEGRPEEEEDEQSS